MRNGSPHQKPPWVSLLQGTEPGASRRDLTGDLATWALRFRAVPLFGDSNPMSSFGTCSSFGLQRNAWAFCRESSFCCFFRLQKDKQQFWGPLLETNPNGWLPFGFPLVHNQKVVRNSFLRNSRMAFPTNLHKVIDFF